eukprot:4723705-Amphidinium_carterae.1
MEQLQKLVLTHETSLSKLHHALSFHILIEGKLEKDAMASTRQDWAGSQVGGVRRMLGPAQGKPLAMAPTSSDLRA